MLNCIFVGSETILERKVPYNYSRVVVKSFLFPQCCRSSIINISVINTPTGRKAQLHAVFTDLDIPPMSVIQVCIILELNSKLQV